MINKVKSVADIMAHSGREFISGNGLKSYLNKHNDYLNSVNSYGTKKLNIAQKPVDNSKLGV